METTLSGCTECHVRHWLSSEWKVLWEHRAGDWEAAPAPGGETRKRCVLRPVGASLELQRPCGAVTTQLVPRNIWRGNQELVQSRDCPARPPPPPATPSSYLPVSL